MRKVKLQYSSSLNVGTYARLSEEEDVKTGRHGRIMGVSWRERMAVVCTAFASLSVLIKLVSRRFTIENFSLGGGGGHKSGTGEKSLHNGGLQINFKQLESFNLD